MYNKQKLESFNDENAWNNKKELFNIYFKNIFIQQQHDIVNLQALTDDLSFDESIDIMKKN